MEEKCHHEKLKQQINEIIKCLNCFPNSKIVQPSLKEMNNDIKVETAIAGLNCWASYATAWLYILQNSSRAEHN